jgi:hypothetical protein
MTSVQSIAAVLRIPVATAKRSRVADNFDLRILVRLTPIDARAITVILYTHKNRENSVKVLKAYHDHS